MVAHARWLIQNKGWSLAHEPPDQAFSAQELKRFSLDIRNLFGAGKGKGGQKGARWPKAGSEEATPNLAQATCDDIKKS